jgi:uncharacterized protein
MIEFLRQPWPWYVCGPLITFIMFLMIYFGKTFSASSSMRTLCAAGGAGKFSDFFRYDWKAQTWNLLFLGGSVIGAFIAANFLTNPEPVAITAATQYDLYELGVQQVGNELVPSSIFSWENLFTLKGFIFMVMGGFFVGFGTRYANGCTSGHSISGLSNLQLPSLIATIGFFVGGLIMTWLILPYLFKL